MTPFTLDYLARLETWALMAVLLQGALVYLSWSAWERATRASAAAQRHRLACLHFAALVVLPALTLAILHGSVQLSVADLVNGGPSDSARPAGMLGPFLAGYHWILKLAVPTALVWAAGAAAIGAWLALGGYRLGRLRTRPAAVELIEDVRRLASRWKTPPSAEVREADVDAPQVIGLRRPVLLVPRHFTERLAPAEREAVLLHELAHVARGDFGWNLLQRLMLAALWFHPAAWLLHARLRREREIRCDAVALGQGASPAGLARALVRLAEERARPRLAMGLSNWGDLSVRLRRLVRSGEGEPSGRSARLAAAMASAACVLTLGAGQLGLADPSIRDAYLASAFGPTISIDARDPAGAFSLHVRHGRVVAATVGQTPLPATHIVQHGERVVLIGPARQPVVAFTVSPQGRIRWMPRL